MSEPISYTDLRGLADAIAYLKGETPPLLGIAVSEYLYAQIEREVMEALPVPFNGVLQDIPICKSKALNGDGRAFYPIYQRPVLQVQEIPLGDG